MNCSSTKPLSATRHMRRTQDHPQKRVKSSLLEKQKKSAAQPATLEKHTQSASASLLDVYEKYDLLGSLFTVPCPAFMFYLQSLDSDSSDESKSCFSSSGSLLSSRSLPSSKLLLPPSEALNSCRFTCGDQSPTAPLLMTVFRQSFHSTASQLLFTMAPSVYLSLRSLAPPSK